MSVLKYFRTSASIAQIPHTYAFVIASANQILVTQECDASNPVVVTGLYHSVLPVNK